MTHTLHVEARRWFQSTYGNTYHTVRVWIDTEEGELADPISTPERVYGYGDAYLSTAGTLVRDGWPTVLREQAGLARLDSAPYDIIEALRRHPDWRVVVKVTDVPQRRGLTEGW